MSEGEVGEANFGISKSSVSELRQEPVVPEENLLENHQSLFYKLAKVTRASLIPRTESHRPLSLRTERAQLFKEVVEARKKGLTGEAHSIIFEAKIRDEIAKQYLNQGEVSVEFSDLGEQKARFIHIKPPKEVDKNLDPIFLIPGISNDIDCVGWLVQELAYQGREVVTVGFPDSFMGSVTSQFADAVEGSESYGPHTIFFKQALNKLIFDGKKKELWGYSTGAPIIAEMLQDENLRRRVSKAVLICPASSSDMSKTDLNLGIAQDGVFLASKLSDTSKYTFTKGRNESEVIEPEGKVQRGLKEKIFNRLLTKVRNKKDTWKSARVNDGGEIVVVSGQKDNMTRSRKTFYDEPELRKFNPQIRLVDLPDGHHVTPLIQPEVVLAEIHKNFTPIQTI